MSNFLERYGLLGFIKLIYYKIRSYFIFRNAKIIRFPIRIRGKKLIKVGKGFVTGYNCRLDAFSKENRVIINIGNNVEINDNVQISATKSIKIDDNVLIASRVYISDHDHGSYGTNKIHNSPDTIPKNRKLFSSEISIGKNVWIGQNVCILKGVKIGSGCIIGANSLVISDIPVDCIAVGSPAKVIKKFNRKISKWEKVN